MPFSLRGLTYGLRRRLTLVFGLLIAAIVAAAIVTNIAIQRELIEARLDARTSDLGELTAEVTSSYLFDMRIAELELIYEDIERQPDVEFIYFVNSEGRKLVTGNIGDPGSSFLEAVEDALVDRAVKTGEVQRSRSTDFEHVARPVTLGTERLGTVRFAIGRNEYDRALKTVWWRNLGVGAVFVLAGSVLSWLLARMLTGPLDRLTAMADRAARGEFDQRIELGTNDELGGLANSFNTMLGTVRESLAENHRLAYHDKLTGLPNRAWLHKALDRALAEAVRDGCGAALLFPDLDQFKRLNDTLGHHVGDELLRAVASRMLGCIERHESEAAGPAGVTLSRLGGDEFTIVLPRTASPEAAARLAERIIAAFGDPFVLDGMVHAAATSIGIAMFPADGDSVELLLKHADIAMYQAKQAGRNTYRFYDAQMATAALQRLSLERELRIAIDENQFELNLQPQFAVASGEVVGAEALVRWRHPTAGMIPPDRFLAIAEEARLMPALGRRVIEAALPLAREWAFFRDAPLRLAINVSVGELEAEGFGVWGSSGSAPSASTRARSSSKSPKARPWWTTPASRRTWRCCAAPAFASRSTTSASATRTWRG